MVLVEYAVATAALLLATGVYYRVNELPPPLPGHKHPPHPHPGLGYLPPRSLHPVYPYHKPPYPNYIDDHEPKIPHPDAAPKTKLSKDEHNLGNHGNSDEKHVTGKRDQVYRDSKTATGLDDIGSLYRDIYKKTNRYRDLEEDASSSVDATWPARGEGVIRSRGYKNIIPKVDRPTNGQKNLTLPLNFERGVNYDYPQGAWSYGFYDFAGARRSASNIRSRSEEDDLNIKNEDENEFLPKIFCSLGVGREFDPSHLPLSSCSHVILSSPATTIVAGVPLATDAERETYLKMASMKSTRPGTKILLSISSEHSTWQVLSVDHRRKRFLSFLMTFLDLYDFDGLVLDWSHRNQFLPLISKQHLGKFLHDLSEVWKENPKHLLAVSVAPYSANVMHVYPVEAIISFADFVLVNSQNFKIPNWTSTTHQSPLFPWSNVDDNHTIMNMAWAAQFWAGVGIPRRKILLGLSFQGRLYELADAQQTGFDSPTIGNGFDQETISYDQVCLFLREGATVVHDPFSKVPYAFKNRKWISFEDVSSLEVKAKWAKMNRFGGFVIYNLDSDDWQGRCGQGDFPLLNAIGGHMDNPAKDAVSKKYPTILKSLKT